jgi:protein tyrosine/serine phosphatase
MRACRRVLRTYGAAVVLAFALAIPAIADSGHSHLDAINIANFGQVSKMYYRGAQPVGHDFTELATLGVKTVIDLQAYGDPREPAAARAAGLHYVNIGMSTRVVPTDDQLKQFLAIVNDPAQQPVYVHCAGGHHRTGVMTAIYRMTMDGWTGEQAFAEMKKYGFGADVLHPEFKEFVLSEFVPPPPAPLPAVLETVRDVAAGAVDALTN